MVIQRGRDANTAGVPSGYIEDVGKPRTKLETIFSIHGG